jgi:hypothetical protein
VIAGKLKIKIVKPRIKGFAKTKRKNMRPPLVMLYILYGLALSYLTGCSVGMAMSGKPDPNIGVLSKGQSRDIVLLNLGQPTQTSTIDTGRVDVFNLERGNEQSVGRAVGHAVMDVLTIGMWEVVGTPIEAFTGDKFTVTVEYDQNDSVTKVTTTNGHSSF